MWAQWAATAQAKRIQVAPGLATMLQQPVWVTTHPGMISDAGVCAARLANGPETRRWCLHGASNGVLCLQDLVAPADRWPTWPEFHARKSHGNPATRVRLDQHGNMVLVLAYRAGMVYNHLSLLYDLTVRPDYSMWRTPRRD